MNRIAGRAGVVLVLVFLLAAGFGFFLCEYVMQSDTWVLTQGSPHVYTPEGLADCGIVTDRNGTLLMDLRGRKDYSTDEKLRMATVHWLGDREGNINAPILSNYVPYVISYDLVNGIYQYGKSKGVITTTVSAEVQKVALEALGTYKGTVAVYNYRTGELICAVSTPTIDPDDLPDIDEDAAGNYEGVYLNRFTQSTYVPGSIFKVVTLAAALESIPDILQRSFYCTGRLDVGTGEVTCGEDVHYAQDLKTAFRNSCNCAFAQIALEMGAETLERYITQFGITEPITIDGLVTAAGSVEVRDTASVNLAWSAVGQHNDQINPGAFLTFVGAVGNGGVRVDPYFVRQTAVGSEITYAAPMPTGVRIMTEVTANTIREFMEFNVVDKYGSGHFPGLTVCAKTGTAEVGGGKKPNAMLTGFVADAEYPLAFIICVENAGYGKTVCIPMASKILEACKTELNS